MDRRLKQAGSTFDTCANTVLQAVHRQDLFAKWSQQGAMCTIDRLSGSLDKVSRRTQRQGGVGKETKDFVAPEL